MGILGKLAFWKKDEFDIGSLNTGSHAPDSYHPGSSDPFSHSGSDPFQASDPLKQSDPFQSQDPFATKDPFAAKDPFSSEGFGKRINQFAAGTGAAPDRPPPGYDSVSTRSDQNTFGGYSHSGSMDKDLQVIIAKMDTIKASVEILGHKIEKLTDRLAAIEAIARQEQNQNW